MLEEVVKMLPELVEIVCICGRTRTVRWSFGPMWRCDCGELHYVDPAGRHWGTEAITYAHEKHDYFGALFEPEQAQLDEEGVQ